MNTDFIRGLDFSCNLLIVKHISEVPVWEIDELLAETTMQHIRNVLKEQMLAIVRNSNDGKIILSWMDKDNVFSHTQYRIIDNDTIFIVKDQRRYQLTPLQITDFNYFIRNVIFIVNHSITNVSYFRDK